MLDAAAILLFSIGIAHSVLGERYILIRLFRKSSLPPLFGGEEFTRQTLRFAWHITTVVWWGFAFILLNMDGDYDLRRLLLATVTSVFSLSFLIALIASKGKHYSWVIFAAIAILCFLSI